MVVMVIETSREVVMVMMVRVHKTKRMDFRLQGL